MVEKEEKFIVINLKHLKDHQDFLDMPHLFMDRGNYIPPYTLKKTERDLEGFFATIEALDNRNKYITCNQDEPYAEKVWQTIYKARESKNSQRGSMISDNYT